MRLLGGRERSAAEVRRRLRDKGYDPETVEHTIERLQTHGLQDDRRFAQAFAASSVRSRGLSSRVIQTELRKRGLAKELAAEAATRSPEEEAETARRAAAGRARRLSGYPSEVRARRLRDFLARRGYDAELCRTVVEEVLAEAGDIT